MTQTTITNLFIFSRFTFNLKCNKLYYLIHHNNNNQSILKKTKSSLEKQIFCYLPRQGNELLYFICAEIFFFLISKAIWLGQRNETKIKVSDSVSYKVTYEHIIFFSMFLLIQISFFLETAIS